MEIVLGEWFNLPRLGKEVFSRLMRTKLAYDKKQGFKVEADTDVIAVQSILSSALGEDVNFSAKCFICHNPTGCGACSYKDVCDVRKVSPTCICKTCLIKDDASALWSLTFANLSSASDVFGMR